MDNNLWCRGDNYIRILRILFNKRVLLKGNRSLEHNQHLKYKKDLLECSLLSSVLVKLFERQQVYSPRILSMDYNKREFITSLIMGMTTSSNPSWLPVVIANQSPLMTRLLTATTNHSNPTQACLRISQIAKVLQPTKVDLTILATPTSLPSTIMVHSRQYLIQPL